MVEAGALEQPLLTIGRGWAVYVGPVEPGRVHRHQAAQLAWCSEGKLTLEGTWGMLEAPGHFLPAGVPHRLMASQPVRMVYLDPATMKDSPLPSRTAAVAALTALQAGALELELDRWLNDEAWTDARCAPRGPHGDERWGTVLQWLEQALDAPVRVVDAAHAVSLSPSRFMHWFAGVSGLSFRAYVRWLRLQLAVRSLADGNTLTEAAHLAGFADSAHLTRTFVATFGVRPASLRSARIVCADSAEPPVSPHGLAFVEGVCTA